MSTPALSTCATSSPDISSFGLSISSPAFRSRSPIVNPLDSAGLICPDLMDILATPTADATVAKRRVKRISGARDLTATEYIESLREDKRRKEEAEEEKRKRKEKRLGIRDEKERKKEEKRNGSVRGRGRGRGKGKGKEKATSRGYGSEVSQNYPPSTSATMSSDSEPEVGILPVTSSRSRRRQLPARFRDDDDSDGNDGVLCTICGFNEPEGLSSYTIFLDRLRHMWLMGS